MSGLMQAIKLAKLDRLLIKQGSLNKLQALSKVSIKPKNSKSMKNIGSIRTFSSQINNLQKSKLPRVFMGSSLSIGLVGGAYYFQNDIRYNLSDLKDIFKSDNLSNLFKAFIGLFIKFAECEVERNHRRTDHYEKTIVLKDKSKKKKDEPAFDWYEFFQMIWKEKFYFFAAIAVS